MGSQRSRKWRTGLARLLVVTAMAGGALGVVVGAPPEARAECDGGSAFAWSVAHARAAVVGTIASVDTDLMGFARSVRVERAYRIRPGAILKGKFWPGDACAGDEAVVGARVVVLLGVPFPGAPNAFFTIGKTVTPWQAAHLGRDLPDTDAQPMLAAPVSSPPWPLLAAGVLGFGLAWARVRPGGEPRRRPRPRTRAA